LGFASQNNERSKITKKKHPALTLDFRRDAGTVEIYNLAGQSRHEAFLMDVSDSNRWTTEGKKGTRNNMLCIRISVIST